METPCRCHHGQPLSSCCGNSRTESGGWHDAPPPFYPRDRLAFPAQAICDLPIIDSKSTTSQPEAASAELTQWPALLRGSVLSSTQSKHVQYISLADRRAQVVIMINAFLIPLAISAYQNPQIRLGITLYVLAAAASIVFAVMCLMPKRYQTAPGEKSNLLHFSGIWQYDEATYKALMRESLENRNTITELMISDIYHLSHDVLRPKFRWMRLSFYAFLCGLLSALLFIALPLAL